MEAVTKRQLVASLVAGAVVLHRNQILKESSSVREISVFLHQRVSGRLPREALLTGLVELAAFATRDFIASPDSRPMIPPEDGSKTAVPSLSGIVDPGFETHLKNFCVGALVQAPLGHCLDFLQHEMFFRTRHLCWGRKILQTAFLLLRATFEYPASLAACTIANGILSGNSPSDVSVALKANLRQKAAVWATQILVRRFAIPAERRGIFDLLAGPVTHSLMCRVERTSTEPRRFSQDSEVDVDEKFDAPADFLRLLMGRISRTDARRDSRSSGSSLIDDMHSSCDASSENEDGFEPRESDSSHDSDSGDDEAGWTDCESASGSRTQIVRQQPPLRRRRAVRVRQPAHFPPRRRILKCVRSRSSACSARTVWWDAVEPALPRAESADAAFCHQGESKN